MKKLLPVLAPSVIALVVASGIAYAQTGSTKSNSALTTEVGSNLPDNTTGLITPFTLRQTLLDMVSSTPIACVTAPTATSYTLLTSDYGCLVTFNTSTSITVNLSTPSVRFPFVASINNLGTGSVTITPVTGTINNSSSLNVVTSGAAVVYSDGANYKAFQVSGSASVSGGAPGAVALWNSSTILTNDIGITFTSPGQLSLNLGNVSATTAFNTNPRAISIVGTWNSSGAVFDAPLFMNITNSASSGNPLLQDLQVGGSTVFKVDFAGNVNGSISNNNTIQFTQFRSPSTGVWANEGGYFTVYTGMVGWAPSTFGGSTSDLALYRDQVINGTPTVLGLANNLNKNFPVGVRVYNTTDQVGSGILPTTYERGIFDWTSSTNTLTIGTQANGAGLGRTVMFVASGTKAMSISPTLVVYGQSNPGANETYAVCAGSGATSLTAGGQVFVDTTACLASSMLVKHDIAAFNDYGMTKLASLAAPLHAEHRLANSPIDIDPVAEAMALVPAVATYDTLGSGSPEFTLIAQNVCQVDERLCERTRDGEIRTFKPNSVISILVAAIQKQQHEIDELKRRLH